MLDYSVYMDSKLQGIFKTYGGRFRQQIEDQIFEINKFLRVKRFETISVLDWSSQGDGLEIVADGDTDVLNAINAHMISYSHSQKHNYFVNFTHIKKEDSESA